MTQCPFDATDADCWEPTHLRAEIERSLQLARTLLISGRLGSGRTRAAELARQLLQRQGESVIVHRLDGPYPIPGSSRLILIGPPGIRPSDVHGGGPIKHISLHPWSRSEIRRALRGEVSDLMADRLHRATAGHLGYLRCWAAAGMPEDLTAPEIWQPFVDRAVDHLPADALALAEELCSGFRALGEPTAPALSGAEPAAGGLDELDRAGLLAPDGELIPAAVLALRRRVSAYRRHQLRNAFLDVLTDPAPHGALLLELAATTPDHRLGPHLLTLGERAAEADPSAARAYLDAARSHGATGPRLHAAAAEAALAAGDTHTAVREAEQALTAESGEIRRRALLVAEEVWLTRGDPYGAADLNRRYASDASILEATRSFLVHLRVGDVAQAARCRRMVAELPATTVDDTTCRFLVDELYGMATAERSPDPDLLDRLCELAGELSAHYRRTTGWTTIAAPIALAGGRAAAAAAMLTAIPEAERTVEERLLLGWAELRQGHLSPARELLAERCGVATPRTDLLTAGLALAIAHHGNDRDALAREWPEAVTAAGRCRPDLFGVVAHPELLVAAARLRQQRSIAQARIEVQQLLGRLGFPPLWSNLIDWAEIQAAILTDAPDQVREPAQRLRRATATSVQAQVMASAGRAWLNVLARDFDPKDVYSAVQELAEIGNATDGARLAAHAAARCEDAYHRRELLDLARQTDRSSRQNGSPADPDTGSGLQLTEREVDVAALVVQHLNYREVGERLFLSPRTVENHIARIKRRAGVTHRRELLELLSQTLRDLGRLD